MNKKPWIRSLDRNWAAVGVKKIANNTYEVIPGSVCLLPSCQKVCERPEVRIVDKDGNELKAEGKFLWTANTIDPYHMVADVF